MWQSIEFVLISKYEIITEEFSKNLPKTDSALLNGSDLIEPELWTTINEFLSLKCAPGAINSSVKEQLLQTLQHEAMKTIDTPNAKILDGLLITLYSTAMQNFYKSNPDSYAKFIGTNLHYMNKTVCSTSSNWLNENRDKVNSLVTTIKTFAKQTPLLDVFVGAFTESAFTELTELIIIVKEHQIDLYSEYFTMVQELYFPEGGAELKTALTERKGTTVVERILNGPIHTCLMVVEAFLIAFKHDTDLQKDFLKYLLEFYFTEEQFHNVKALLECITYYFRLLNRHDTKLKFQIEDVGAIQYIGGYVQRLTDANFETHLCEVLDLLTVALQLDPMILDRALMPIVVRCMIARKDDRTIEQYELFMQIVIDIYRRLSRAHKFVSDLIRELWDRLQKVKLSKKNKRKSIAGEQTPMKKQKLENGRSSDQYNINDDDDDDAGKLFLFSFLYSSFFLFTNTINIILILSDKNKYFKLLKLSYTTKSTTLTKLNDKWNDISFAWSETIGQSFSKLISNLVSKPSLIVWKTLLFVLKDYVNLLVEGNSNENTLFLVDLMSTLLCQYFMGTRVAEQSDKIWNLIEEHRQLTHPVLKDFGAAILSQEHNIRTMNSFLKMCLHAGNFDLLCWYYAPDSMSTDSLATEQYPDLTQLDRGKLADTIHSYLLPQQWTLIEQRITNFGKDGCKANINGLYLQRLKAQNLFKLSRNVNIGNHVLSSTFEDVQQIKKILASDGRLFLNNLTRAEKISVCELLVDDNVDMILSSTFHNKEFLTILFISIVKRIGDNFESKKSLFNSIDFDVILSEDERAIPELTAAIAKHIAREHVSIKKYSKECIANYMKLLSTVTVDYVDQKQRDLLLLLQIVLYCNVKATADVNLRNECFSLITGN